MAACTSSSTREDLAFWLAAVVALGALIVGISESLVDGGAAPEDDEDAADDEVEVEVEGLVEEEEGGRAAPKNPFLKPFPKVFVTFFYSISTSTFFADFASA